MRRPCLAATIAAVAVLFATTDARAQSVFEETFTDPGGCSSSASPTAYFPAGWTRYNVDNLTPDNQVAYVDEAWIVRGNFGSIGSPPTDCVAFSTSFYTPPGTAADFMCTPQINLPAQSRLTWQAAAYDPNFRDGYQVRIMRAAPTGGPGMPGNLLTASRSIFTIAQEISGTLASHAVNLHLVPQGQGGPYANEPVYICFRNSSNDQFLLIVDNVKVAAVYTFDAAAQSPLAPSEYTIVPAEVGGAIARGATVRNDGVQGLTGVTLTAETLRDGQVIDTDVSPPIATLAAGASQAITFDPAPLDAAGTYAVRYTVDATEADGNAANDSVSGRAIVVSDEYARDDGVTVNSISIGAGNGGELGQAFVVGHEATLTALRFWISEHGEGSNWPGSTIVAHLRAFDTVENEPGAIIASTEAYVPTDNAALALTLDFPVPPVLTPGTYVVTVAEPAVGGDGMPGTSLLLEQSSEIFTPGTQWVDWPTSPFGGWTNVETFGVAGFARPFRLRMVFGDPTPPPDAMYSDGFENPSPPVSAPTASGEAPRRGGPVHRTVTARRGR